MENQEEMDNFLYRYQLLKFKQDQINHLSCLRTPRGEAVIYSLPTKEKAKTK